VHKLAAMELMQFNRKSGVVEFENKITVHVKGALKTPIRTDHCAYCWQASEVSETLSGINHGNQIYIYSTCNLNFVAWAQNDV